MYPLCLTSSWDSAFPACELRRRPELTLLASLGLQMAEVGPCEPAPYDKPLSQYMEVTQA